MWRDDRAMQLPRAAVLEQPPLVMSRVQRIVRWANRLAERADRSRVLPIAVLSLLYVVVTIVFAHRKLMWNDELYTYYMARLPTMSHVWAALMSGGEQTPPFFYWTTRVSFALFGVNNLSVRLPEILGFWLMLAALYVFVARRASSLSALCAAAFPLVTYAYSYAFEARAYGLLLGFGALALLSWQSVTLNRQRSLSLVCLGVSVAAAVSTQYYGVLVLLPLAFGEGVLTLTRRRLDIAVWSALAVSIVPLALHLPLIRAGTAYSSAFWSRPQWVNVPDFYIHLLTPAIVPVAFILVLGGVYPIVVGGDGAAAEASPARSVPLHEVAAACGFIIIPFVCVVLAKLATGAFVNRYAMPAVIGFAVLAGFGSATGFRRSAVLRFAIAVSLAGWFILSLAREFKEPTGFSMPVSEVEVNRATEWLANRDRDLPVVVADPQSFAVLSHYGSGEIKSRIVYLADPGLALKHLGHNSVERGMLDLVRPWFGMNVVEFEPYMAGHSRFLLYGDFVRLSFLNWLVPELHARGWRTELLHLSGNDMLFLASRNLSATGPADPAGPAGVLTGASTGTLTRDRQATHAQQPVLAR
jgi:4-amino-4-deoxy-L-arabinose transferase-like glycosyltransferase